LALAIAQTPTKAKQVMGFDVDICPCCKKGKMITDLFFDAHAPPAIAKHKNITVLK